VAGVRNRVWLLAGALALVALGLVALSLLRPARRSPPPPPAREEPAPPRREARAHERAAPLLADARPRPVAAPPAAEPEAPAESEPRPRGPSGIALFPPPGTDPVKIGIVVPDDYVLPEGYVRHHQVTDDGRDLSPILMFHPDFEWVGPDGQPIEIPADRVVPPELAPPDLPIRMLEPPEAEEEPAP
jgi:hypothetical protein